MFDVEALVSDRPKETTIRARQTIAIGPLTPRNSQKAKNGSVIKGLGR
jgi:hypothetical protein